MLLIILARLGLLSDCRYSLAISNCDRRFNPGILLIYSTWRGGFNSGSLCFSALWWSADRGKVDMRQIRDRVVHIPIVANRTDVQGEVRLSVCNPRLVLWLSLSP